MGMVVIALIVALVLVVASRGDKKKPLASGPGEIFLTPASSQGSAPFTPSVAAPPPTSATTTSTTPTSGAPATAATPTGPVTARASSGAEPGLYGGTKNVSTCNKQQMIDYLAANPSKAAAWAAAEGISVSEVSSYIEGLTPVRLRYDTRVTNHGYSNGTAYPIQEVLQAGTAVLVDAYGYPRARCFCGNPLTPPEAVSTTPRYLGPPWEGFEPTSTRLVTPSVKIITVIQIIDSDTGKLVGRPVGTDGRNDTDADPGGTVFGQPGGGAPTGSGRGAIPVGTPIGYQANLGPPTLVGSGSVITQQVCDEAYAAMKTVAMNVTFGPSTLTLAARGTTLSGPYNQADGSFSATATKDNGNGVTAQLSMVGKVAPAGAITGVYQTLVAGSGQGCTFPLTAGAPPSSPAGTSTTQATPSPSGPIPGVFDVQYPPAADATCPDTPPATLIVATSVTGITIAAQSSQFTDQLAGSIDSTHNFSVHGIRPVGGGLGIAMTGQFDTAVPAMSIRNGQLTFSGPSGPCTFSFTATRRSG
ncbi:MAG: hypothetical protein M3N98_15905 [Actinomycetota bacterium]|nr:hypothetical protein [Actinomycetota bacterium]